MFKKIIKIMRYLNYLQRIVAVISLVLISFTAAAQDDIIVVAVDENGITIPEGVAESALLIKNDDEVPNYYIYTSAKYIKPVFGKDRGNISKDIYLSDENSDGKFFDASKEPLDPEKGFKRTIIGYEDRLIGNAEEKDKAKFRIVDKNNNKDRFSITICCAENYLATLNCSDSTLISISCETTRVLKDGAILFSISDTATLNKIDIKIPAYTFLKEVRVADDVAKSYDDIALSEVDFSRDRNLEFCPDSTIISRLYAGEEITIKYVSLNEKGALAKQSVVRCKLSIIKAKKPFYKRVIEYITSVKWWVYVIIASVLVLVIAIGFIILGIRKRNKCDITENDKLFEPDNNPKINTVIKEDSAELKRLTDELNEVKQQLQSKESDLKAVNSKLETCAKELNTKEEDLSKVNESLETTKRELEAANNTIAENQNELTLTREQLNQAKSELADIEERHNAEMSSMASKHNSEVEKLQESHNTKIAEIVNEYEGKLEVKANEYEALEAKRSKLELQWKSDRGQVIKFFQSQLYFIDKYLEVITEKADRNSPIYDLLLQLSDTAYGYNIFRTRVIETLQNEERDVAELVKDVRSFVEENMTADMSWINNAARLYAYASTIELKSIFGNYNDAENDTRLLIDQIKILVAMWGITDIQIPLLFVTPFNDDEFAYDISNLVLPTLYPDCIDLQKDNIIYDFLRVGFVVNGNKVKPKVAY